MLSLHGRAPRTTTQSSETENRESDSQHSDITEEQRVYGSLRKDVCVVFAEVQQTSVGHRKSQARLRKLQESCCYEAQRGLDCRLYENYDESDFNRELLRCVLRVLTMKKSESTGDRLVKFLASFLKVALNLDNELFLHAKDPYVATDDETPTARLITQTITLLVPMMSVKDKIVRFRSTQIVSQLVNTLDAIDDESFKMLKTALTKRLKDKESSIRVHAIYGLGRLASEVRLEDCSSAHVQSDLTVHGDHVESGGDETMMSSIRGMASIERLIDLLQNDPSSEVRRSILINLPFSTETLPYLLERARDSDAANRRALYSRILPALGDFRHLSLTYREKLLRWGLRDRDEQVKRAAVTLFQEHWIDDCREVDDRLTQSHEQHSIPSLQALLELLERIDVLNAGNEGGIAIDAMYEFWRGRPDYCDFIKFDDGFWTDLSPESIFVARTFNDFCHRCIGENSTWIDKIPEVTRIAFLAQKHINALLSHSDDGGSNIDVEEETVQQEFISEQLLHIASTLDYSDEVGRRIMHSLMRETLSLADLPEAITRLVVQVLRISCGNNRTAEVDFSAVVIEAIAEVHDSVLLSKLDSDEREDSFHSARSDVINDTISEVSRIPSNETDKSVKIIMINMKCLHIAQCLLENVQQTLESNKHLVSMLNNLIVPAVRSQEAPIRERGLLCLGLCCLLDRNLAEENLTLFLHCFSKGHEALQTIALQILGDILTVHISLLLHHDTEQNETEMHHPRQFGKSINKLLYKALRSSSGQVQTTACAVASKLLLASPTTETMGPQTVLDTVELIRLLTMIYFHPNSADTPALHQSLAYFLPVYCHSRPEHMQVMGRLAPDILKWYLDLREEHEVDDTEDALSGLVGINIVISHLADWTDARRLATEMLIRYEHSHKEEISNVQLNLCVTILGRLHAAGSRSEKKAYISLLSKLHFASPAKFERLETATMLLDQTINNSAFADATARTTLNRVQASISKLLGIAEESSLPNNKDVEAGATIAQAESLPEEPVEDSDM